MTGFLENNTSEEYERLRQAIGQPDYDTLPTGPHQPFTEEELRQVTQPLNLGDEHQGEANYAAIEGNNGESKEGGREEEGSEEGGDNEEAGADGLKEEAEGNTRGGKNAPGCKESEGGSKVSEVKAGEDARSSSPSNADTDEAHDNYSDGQDEFDRLVQGEETSEDEEEGESAQRDTAALGGRNDNEERWSLPLRYTPKHRRDSPRFVKRFEEKVTTMQVDLDGNLTAATRKAMERRRATDSGLGALEDLINRGAPPELGLLEEKSVAGIADLPLSPSQCSAAPSSIAAGDVSEVPPLSLDKAEAPFRVEDFLLSSPQEPGGNPPSFPTSLPLAAPSSSLQPSDGPALSPPYPWPPQAGRVPPHSRPLKDVAGMPPVYPHADTVMNPGERAPHPTPQSRTPDTEGVAKSNGDKALGVQKAPMKGNASKGRAQRACNVAQGISEATGGKSVFMQNGRRVRVVKVPRPTASEILPPRPPLYPVSNHPTLAYLTPVYPWPSHRTALNRAPPCPTQIPLADQPSPATQLPPQGVGNLPQELYVRRRQPGSSAGHAELVRLLDTLRNLPPRSVNRDESFRAAGPAPDGNLVSAPTNTTIPTSGNANVDMRGSGCPGQEQVSQGPGSEAEAATPTAQTPTERKSAKRKLEMTAEERQEKKRIRAIRNRQSAEKSRRRRKEYAVSLEANVEILRKESQEWRRSYRTGLTRLSSMQGDIREIYGENHEIRTPAMHDVVDDVGDMVRRCPFTFSREAPEIELRNVGEDGRRGGRGRGGGRGQGRSGRGGRGRGGRGRGALGREVQDADSSENGAKPTANEIQVKKDTAS